MERNTIIVAWTSPLLDSPVPCVQYLRPYVTKMYGHISAYFLVPWSMDNHIGENFGGDQPTQEQKSSSPEGLLLASSNDSKHHIYI